MSSSEHLIPTRGGDVSFPVATRTAFNMDDEPVYVETVSLPLPKAVPPPPKVAPPPPKAPFWFAYNSLPFDFQKCFPAEPLIPARKEKFGLSSPFFSNSGKSS